MDLTFFLHQNILESGKQFFKEILSIDVAPATISEIKIRDFINDQLTDEKLLDKVANARFIGIINDLSIEGKKQEKNVDSFLRYTSEDYDMLLVFGIELKKGIVPSKSDISRLTRALNRRSLNRPVVVLMKYSNKIAFSAAERGQYKRKGQRGEKVGRISILREININKVHAGHERILLQIRINPLKVSNFKDLYAQWQEVFNLKTLNNDFYKKIADWYFWATKVVKFPIDHYKTLLVNGNRTDEDLQVEANQIALIRFITRIVFIWFLKSKDYRIIPEDIFDYDKLKKHLRFNDEFNSNYYKAILQNLFFATLNTKMDSPQRTFSEQKRTTFLENRYRYKSLFIEPGRSTRELFSNIPFLNGGLFSNLDYKISDKKTVRVDWFSDPAEDFPKNKLYFPDFLFFDKEHEEDLSSFYETKAKQKVKGLIPILKEYYFTIEENTPLEQEIALDPELLGKIFENLLASYNPETRTTARKQTGSYYTPREIVTYMVDESLIAFLKTKITEKARSYQELGNQQFNMFGNEGKNQLSLEVPIKSSKWEEKKEELESKVRELFAYENEINPFQNDKETTNSIIFYLSECKILDPACGSGAFPMGVLHQIVHALKKLDKDNEQWKQVQYERLIAPEVSKITGDISIVQKISSEEARKKAEDQLHLELNELLDNFARHDHNYTRKLHLIENCIYGVDIQPIAIHISKLRFFISLLVDQNIDFNQRNKNYLLNPLPNLETKFVAANTLIPLNPGGQLTTREEKIISIETKIKAERGKYFDCKSREEKLKIERRDEELRKEFASELKQLTEQGRCNLLKHIEKIEAEIETYNRYKATSKAEKDKARIIRGIEALRKDLVRYKQKLEQFAGGDEVANKILNFNPYDANSSAPFFDAEIMFTLQPDVGSGFFDIVIGNPPYVSANNMNLSDRRKIISTSRYNLLIGKWDIYCAFIVQSFTLLKKDGSLAFIVPYGFLNQPFAEAIRHYIANKQLISSLADLHELKIFSATVPTCIPIIHNRFEKEYSVRINELSNNEFTLRYKLPITEYRTAEQNMFRTENLGESSNLINKIKKQGNTLSTWFHVSTGAEIHGKEKYDGDKRISGYSKFNVLYENEKPGLKPYIEGSAIPKSKEGRYCFPKIDYYLDYSKANVMRSPKFPELFDSAKIIIRGSSGLIGILATYDERKLYTPHKITIIIDKNNYPNNIEKTKKHSLKFLLSLLNSKLINFYYQNKFSGFIDVYPNNLKDLPIIDSNNAIIKRIEKTVSLILQKRKEQQYCDDLISKVDLIVYKLYTLTYDECKIVDSEIEKLIGRDDYEKTTVEELSEWDLKG